MHHFDDSSLFVDLFGGSGLLSHTAKCERPDARVIFNDYDNYTERIKNADKTNKILNEVRILLDDVSDRQQLPPEVRAKVIDCIGRYEEKGFVDYITLSSNLLFSGNYVTNFADLQKENLYNRMTKSTYNCANYLDGVETIRCDYRQLFEQYKSVDKVVFIVDPPYLSTEAGTYKNYWKLSDYLDVLNVINNVSYVYFTSNKSSIIELIEWSERNLNAQNPFVGALRKETQNRINKDATYKDIMLYKKVD